MRKDVDLDSSASQKFSSKLLNFFMQVNLAATLMWLKFQVKILKYSITEKVGFYRENSSKTRYVTRNMALCQFVAVTFVAFNSSRSIRRML